MLSFTSFLNSGGDRKWYLQSSGNKGILHLFMRRVRFPLCDFILFFKISGGPYAPLEHALALALFLNLTMVLILNLQFRVESCILLVIYGKINKFFIDL